MIFDRLASTTTAWLSQQSAVFREVFAWLQSMPADQPEGTTELRGRSLYVMVMGYETIPQADCRWESHRRTIDIQYIFQGGEAIGYQHPGVLEPNNDYDAEREVEFYQPSTPPSSTLIMSPGVFAVFLAGEPHRPKGSDGTNSSVRKAVFKIDASLIS